MAVKATGVPAVVEAVVGVSVSAVGAGTTVSVVLSFDDSVERIAGVGRRDCVHPGVKGCWCSEAGLASDQGDRREPVPVGELDEAARRRTPTHRGAVGPRRGLIRRGAPLSPESVRVVPRGVPVEDRTTNTQICDVVRPLLAETPIG